MGRDRRGDPSVAKHVHILTWCRWLEKLHGTTLIFRTLRVGFPNAHIRVVDNASRPDVRPTIQRLAEDCGAEHVQLEQEVRHHAFLADTLQAQAAGTAIFLDPDLCFWEEVEHWNFDALMAGRLLPKYNCEYTGCVSHPRLHTSFLWI